MTKHTTLFWFRRDLRLHDNAGFYKALSSGNPVVPVFIFDSEILAPLPRDDRRISSIYDSLKQLDRELRKAGSALDVRLGRPLEVWKKLVKQYKPDAVFANEDYEPYGRRRDQDVDDMLRREECRLELIKDQVVFGGRDILKKDGTPYTVYTPYKNRWKQQLAENNPGYFPSEKLLGNLAPADNMTFPSLDQSGFTRSPYTLPPKAIDPDIIRNYHRNRDFPGREGTSGQSVYLRLGLASIRQLVDLGLELNETWLDELIWREFFMSILYFFPHVENRSFRPAYDAIRWRNDSEDFDKWCQGRTGFPLVDAGMRQLNETGYMHNRVRMVVANFLTKDLLIDWRWGEQYFAEKLMDYDLAANNGNWQWSAGSGCDAALYFRIFNPETQLKKFDPDLRYIKRWLPEYGTPNYPPPMLDHAFARKRAIEIYQQALKRN